VAVLESCASGEVAAVDPGGDDRRVVIGCLFPGEMAGVEHVDAAVGQAGMEVVGVGPGRDTSPAGCRSSNWRAPPST
jgi:hypothetical protein